MLAIPCMSYSFRTGRKSRVSTSNRMLKQMLYRYQGNISAALVLGGVDINMANDDGNRPLHIALDRWSELQIKQHRAECRPGFEMNLQLLLEQPELDTRVFEAWA